MDKPLVLIIITHLTITAIMEAIIWVNYSDFMEKIDKTEKDRKIEYLKCVKNTFLCLLWPTILFYFLIIKPIKVYKELRNIKANEVENKTTLMLCPECERKFLEGGVYEELEENCKYIQ